MGNGFALDQALSLNLKIARIRGYTLKMVKITKNK
jgi:hypothetical protein